MAVYNVSKGRAAEMFNNVQSGAVANSRITVVAVSSTDTDDAMKAFRSLAAVLGSANTTEVPGGSGYTRKQLAAVDLSALTIEDAPNHRVSYTIPDQTWTGVTGSPWTHLILCYAPDAGSADAAIIPLHYHAFSVTPDGSDIIARPSADGVFRARDG